MNKLFHNRVNLREYTTEIRKAHCDACAKGSCPKAGTFHGKAVPVTEAGILNKLRSLIGLPVMVLKVHNLITNVGHAAANGRMSNQGAYSPFVNIAIGTGTNAASASDTALQTEITTNGGQRGAATATQVTTSVTNDTTQLVKTFTFTGSFAVTEEGILDNASSGGSLLARQVFSAINVVSGDAIQFTHKYQT